MLRVKCLLCTNIDRASFVPLAEQYQTRYQFESVGTLIAIETFDDLCWMRASHLGAQNDEKRRACFDKFAVVGSDCLSGIFSISVRMARHLHHMSAVNELACQAVAVIPRE